MFLAHLFCLNFPSWNCQMPSSLLNQICVSEMFEELCLLQGMESRQVIVKIAGAVKAARK